MVHGKYKGKQFEKTNPISVSPRHCWGLKAILKNKANFTDGQIDVSSFITEYYDIIQLCGARKNKPNFTDGQIGVSSFITEYYDIIQLCGAQKNKANFLIVSKPKGVENCRVLKAPAPRRKEI